MTASSCNNNRGLVAVSPQQKSASATPCSQNTFPEDEFRHPKVQHKCKTKKYGSHSSIDDSCEVEHHKYKGKKKTSKSYDTDSDSETGKRLSRHRSSPSFDRDDKAEEKSKLKVLQPVKNFKAAMDYCTYGF